MPTIPQGVQSDIWYDNDMTKMLGNKASGVNKSAENYHSDQCHHHLFTGRGEENGHRRQTFEHSSVKVWSYVIELPLSMQKDNVLASPTKKMTKRQSMGPWT